MGSRTFFEENSTTDFIFIPSYMYDSYILKDNIYIRFGTKLYRQIVGIPMGTNCAPLVTDLSLFCYERDFMKDLLVITRPT